MKRILKVARRVLRTFLVIFIVGLLIPQNLINPVAGASSGDWHPDSFWFYPWGRSVTHKGVDIFAARNTVVQAPVSGIVLYKGTISMGGNIVLLLGPKWRLHYMAHLESSSVGRFDWVSKGEEVARVGDSGNAVGKPPHLHYSIFTPVPYVWRIDGAKQGYLKMFYLNPIDFFP